MSDGLEWLAHFAGGALISALTLAAGAVALFAILNAAGYGYTRETDQEKAQRNLKRLEARLKGEPAPMFKGRPGNPFRWTLHRLWEWAAWPVGALASIGLYALA